MKEIQNIIFDIGNVLLDLDFDRINSEFQKLLGADFSRLVTSDTTKEIFLQFEKGYYSEESFINALQRQSPKVPQGRAMIDAWNSMLAGMPTPRLKMLQRLKDKGYNLYLLSNTNSLHMHHFKKYLLETHGIEDFDAQFFTKSYYSHLINMRKPWNFNHSSQFWTRCFRDYEGLLKILSSHLQCPGITKSPLWSIF